MSYLILFFLIVYDNYKMASIMFVPFVYQKLKNIKFSDNIMFSIYYFNIPTGSKWNGYSFSMLQSHLCLALSHLTLYLNFGGNFNQPLRCILSKFIDKTFGCFAPQQSHITYLGHYNHIYLCHITQGGQVEKDRHFCGVKLLTVLLTNFANLN